MDSSFTARWAKCWDSCFFSLAGEGLDQKITDVYWTWFNNFEKHVMDYIAVMIIFDCILYMRLYLNPIPVLNFRSIQAATRKLHLQSPAVASLVMNLISINLYIITVIPMIFPWYSNDIPMDIPMLYSHEWWLYQNVSTPQKNPATNRNHQVPRVPRDLKGDPLGKIHRSQGNSSDRHVFYGPGSRVKPWDPCQFDALRIPWNFPFSWEWLVTISASYNRLSYNPMGMS